MSAQTLNVARPILKSTLNSIKSPRPAGNQISLRVPASPRPSSKVHFPPTPTISVIFETHANEVYDRTAIIVSPTSCAIPWSQKNKFNIARATMADIFCTSPSEGISREESLIKGGAAAATSDSEESDDSVPELRAGGTVRFALQLPTSPIPGKRSKFDLEKALSFLPYPGSPYLRSSPSFDPRSPSTDKDTSKGFGVIREAPARLGSNALTVPKAGAGGGRRRPAQLKLDTVAVPSSVRFAPPGLPVSPSPPRSINSILDESDSGSDSESDSENRSLRAAFWRSVTLEKGSSSTSSVGSGGEVDAQALVSPAMASPFPVFLYKNIKSPALPRKSRASAGDFMGNGMVGLEGLTSPAPKDPMAAFTSFGAAFATRA